MYSGPITVAASETVRAISVASGYSASAEGSAKYEIVSPAVAPTFSPAAGTYGSAQKVTITTTTPSSTIHYTTNGTTPTSASPVYTSPITVAATVTVKAIAVPINAANTNTVSLSVSAVSTAAYTIQAPAPSFSIVVSPASITVASGQSASASVQVTPENGYASTVSFSCSGLPSGTSCTFSPTSVTPAGAPVSSTLTVTASKTTSTLPGKSSPLGPGGSLAAAFCCFGWRKRRGLRLVSAALAAALGLGLCIGCGAGPISPVSSSTVSVVATDGSLQPSVSLTITVL